MEAASSAIAVIELSAMVIKLCLQYSKDVANARDDIYRLYREVTNLQHVLESVERLLSNPDGAKLKDTRRLSSAINDGKSLLERLDKALSPGRTRRAMRRIGLRALKWPFQSKDVEKMIRDLGRCTEAISMGLQVDQTAILLDIDQQAVLNRLPVAEGASFDSSAEDRNPKCLPDTRVDLLSEISKWVDDSDSYNVYWLNGMAGTGKSTISRTVAQTLAESNRLGASFFFKRGETDRGGLSKFFTTIAADLVARQPAIAPYIKEAIDADPAVLRKSARAQFDTLILGPLSKRLPNSGTRNAVKDRIVIVIDALDECENDDDVKLLIRLFSRSTKVNFPGLKAFLTSRPELPTRLGFKAIEGGYQDLILHAIAEPIIEHDISSFLRHELSIIRSEYNAFLPKGEQLPEYWPGEANIQSLVKMAVPLFIFASTTCRFIKDRRCGNPPRQLENVLRYHTKSQESKLDATYLPVLEQLLTNLSQREETEALQQFHRIVGSIIILASPLSAAALSKLVEVSQDIVDNRLATLHSVLSVPPSADTPVRLLHLSFRDFLLDPDKHDKTPFWVDEKHAHAKMAADCLRLLGNLKSDICGVQAPGTPRSDIDRTNIDASLPPELQYACLYWVHHVEQEGTQLEDGDQVHQMLLRHFLHWLEALSLMGRAPESISLVKVLQSLLKPQSSAKLSEFLDDAKRFILALLSAIESWPLQIYSLLAFTPMESKVRINFQDDIPSWLSLAPQVERNWSPCLQTLEGHHNHVTSVAFSHDSTIVASGSSDKTIRIWLADNGECVQKLEGHNERVNSLSFSHDLALVASASDDKTVRVWRWKEGDCMHTLEGESAILSVVFSQDSALVMACCQDATTYIWDVGARRCVRKVLLKDGDCDSFWYAAFSHDSTLVASASHADIIIRIWRIDTGDCMRGLEVRSEVRAVAFSHDSSLLVSGSRDDVVRIWKVDTGHCVHELQGHRDSVSSVAFSENSSLIASASHDTTVRIWRTDNGNCIQTLKGHTDRIKSLAFSPDSTRIASTSADFTLLVFGLKGETLGNSSEKELQYHRNAVLSIAVSHDRALVASWACDNIICIWRADNGECTQKLNIYEEVKPFSTALFSRDSSLLACGSQDGTCYIWRVAGGNCISAFKGHTSPTMLIALSFDSKLFASSSLDGTLRIWCVDLGNCIHTLSCGSGALSTAFSRDSALVAFGFYNGGVRILDVKTGNCIQEITGDGSAITSFAFFNDSALVASAPEDGPIRIWRVDTGDCMEIPDGERDKGQVMISDDPPLILSTTHEPLWIRRAETGELVQELELGYQFLPRIECEPDQPGLVTDVGSIDIYGRIWPRSGFGISRDERWVTWFGSNLLRLPVEYRPRASAVAGSTIVLGCGSGMVLVIGFSPENFPHL